MSQNFILVCLIILCCAVNIISMRSISDPSLKKLKIRRLEPGNGRLFPGPAAIIAVDYIITIPSQNLELRNSYISKEPMKMQLGVRQQYQCWDEVIKFMSLGEKVKFYCSQSMGYDDCKLAGEPETAEIEFILELIQVEEYKKQYKSTKSQQNKRKSSKAEL